MTGLIGGAVPTVPSALSPLISEATFSKTFHDLARLLGWRCTHYRPARTSKGWVTALEGDPGAPDWIIARNGRVLLIELKAAKGHMSPHQKLWLEQLGEHGRLWRPSDWATIIQELSTL